MIMSANAFDTLKAAKSLEAAGFDEAQAEAIVATVGGAVRAHAEPLADGIAAIADTMATMATKDDVATVEDNVSAVENNVSAVENNVSTLKDNVATLTVRVETISRTMATKEYVDAALATLRAEIAVDFRNLYRHLWVMGTGCVGVTVALVKLLP